MANMRGIDLNLLIVLDALLDERSVTRAAQRLGYTQSTTSGMLARLRDLFDDPALRARATGHSADAARTKSRSTVEAAARRW